MIFGVLLQWFRLNQWQKGRQLSFILRVLNFWRYNFLTWFFNNLCADIHAGSSGEPKGVRLSNRAIMNRLQWQWQNFPFVPEDRCVFKTSLTFVDSVAEVFLFLLPILSWRNFNLMASMSWWVTDIWTSPSRKSAHNSFKNHNHTAKYFHTKTWPIQNHSTRPCTFFTSSNVSNHQTHRWRCQSDVGVGKIVGLFWRDDDKRFYKYLNFN